MIHRPDLLANSILFDRSEIEGSITSRFRRVVEAVGQRTAIISADKYLSYSDLDVQSSKVASAILEVDPGGSPIPLLCGSDERTVIGLLAALKCGRPYVLLDPNSVLERNRRIVEDLGATSIVYAKQFRSRARGLGGDELEIIEIDSILKGTDPPAVARWPESAPDDLAYIVFTSGTTGKPKGVMQTHRNVLHRAWSYTTTAELTPEDKLALLYSPSASGSVRDVYGALLSGSSLHMYDLRDRGFDQLANWMHERGITVYNSAATVFRHFAATIRSKDDIPALRLVQLGSETIYRADVELYKSRFPDTCKFVARLGCSELSPICKFYVDKHTSINYSTVPAGFPVDGVEVAIMDELGEPVTTGTVGEIVVTSRYLTPGYWAQPETTAAVFESCQPDPLMKRFKTGDLGMVTKEGLLVHMGRKDFQIKIDGFRVEPSEIEAALLDLDFVREAVVVASREKDRWRLVAYVAPEGPTNVIESDLKSVLSKILPAYMIPARFGILPTLPTNSSGKVDRLGLPPISDDTDRPYVPPETAFEKQLVAVLSDVLSIDRVSVRDHFLDLGGTSLAAMQIASRLSSIYGFRLPLHTFFGEKSVAGIAERLETETLLEAAADESRRARDSDSDFEEGVI